MMTMLVIIYLTMCLYCNIFIRKCHAGRACVYDVVSKWNWSMDVRTHRLADVIERVIKPWDGVPECVPEVDCVDCSLWEMVEED
jgi:lipase ATG15